MFEGFQNLVPQIANKLNLSKQLESSHVCTVARKIITSDYPNLAPYLQVVSFKAPYLKIKTSSPVIASELHYIKPEIQQKIEQHLKTKIIITNQY